jgi:hypothetical protein
LRIPLSSPIVLTPHLKLVASLLEDNYLFEMKGHHRADLHDTSRPKVFSLHEWVAHADQDQWRRRLVSFLAHNDRVVRDLASSCLARVGTKVPEVLHESPLRLFTVADSRALFEGLSAAPVQSIDRNMRVDTFLHEVLRRPAEVRLWHSGVVGEEMDALVIALSYLERNRCSALVEDALVSVDFSHLGPESRIWTRALARCASPRAQRILASMVTNSRLSTSARETAIQGLIECGDPDIIGPILDAHDPFGVELAAAIVDLGIRLENRSKIQNGNVPLELTVDDLRYFTRRHRPVRGNAVISLLESISRDDPAVRREAIAAAVSCQLTSVIDRSRPSLIKLGADPDLHVAYAAARGLVTLTARWPVTGPDARRDLLPLELAADELRLHRWSRDWEEWARAHGKESRLDWALEATAYGNVDRRHVGALALLKVIPTMERTTPELVAALREAYRSETIPAMRCLLAQALRRTVSADDFRQFAWSQLSGPTHPEEVEIWNLLIEIEQTHFVLESSGSKAGARGTGLVESLVERIALGNVPEQVAGHLYGFLLSRHPGDTIDQAIGARLSTDPLESRGRLIRFFPAVARTNRVQLLVKFLGEPHADGRFWAATRLRVLAGESFGFEASQPPESPNNSRASHRWQVWLDETFIEDVGHATAQAYRPLNSHGAE